MMQGFGFESMQFDVVGKEGATLLGSAKRKEYLKRLLKFHGNVHQHDVLDDDRSHKGAVRAIHRKPGNMASSSPAIEPSPPTSRPVIIEAKCSVNSKGIYQPKKGSSPADKSWCCAVNFFDPIRTREARLQDLKEKKNITGNAAISGQCVLAPRCLEPKGECLSSSSVVQMVRPECCAHPAEFCDKAVYRLPSSGLVITLPPLSTASIPDLYARVPSQERNEHLARGRAAGQVDMILHGSGGVFRRFTGLAGKSGLTVVEMGCSYGFLLDAVKELARGGRLVCFEPDPTFHGILMGAFKTIASSFPDIQTELVKGPVDFDRLGNFSVDLFMSSHVFEHLPDPCPFLEGLWRVLRPGGHVFTEAPVQDTDPEQWRTRGVFHLMYLNQVSYDNMMRGVGFESLQFDVVGKAGATLLGSRQRKEYIARLLKLHGKVPKDDESHKGALRAIHRKPGHLST